MTAGQIYGERKHQGKHRITGRNADEGEAFVLIVSTLKGP